MRSGGQYCPRGRRIDEVPATVELASSCVALSAVPYVIAEGAVQLMAGVAWFTVSETVVVAVV